MTQPWRTGECVGGRCTGQVNCTRHACLYAKHQMEDRGFVCIADFSGGAVAQDDGAKPVDAAFWTMAQAVQEAGLEMQRWMTGWDDAMGTPRFGVWAPRVAAAILGAFDGTVSADQLTAALRKAKLDPTFAAAVDAAYRVGGQDAAREVVASAGGGRWRAR